MSVSTGLPDIIFNTDITFHKKSLQILEYQLRFNLVYQTFYKSLMGHVRPVKDPLAIPLLPIRAFKYKTLLTTKFSETTQRLTFKSSGTTADSRSTHTVADPAIYQRSIEKEFWKHFPLNQYSIIAYVPGYMDNPDSSLIYMLRYLIQKDPLSYFITDINSSLTEKIEQIQVSDKQWVLFSAAFGLLDLIEKGIPHFPLKPEIIETGGMKTYRREMPRKELRETISSAFQIEPEKIHSEYGMCELLSQMYAIGGEWFTSPPWVKVTIRRADDPMKLCKPGEEGKIGITDLANLYSCPFILTGDRGIMREDGAFQVLGRWDPDDLRGCNFLIDKD